MTTPTSSAGSKSGSNQSSTGRSSQSARTGSRQTRSQSSSSQNRSAQSRSSQGQSQGQSRSQSQNQSRGQSAQNRSAQGQSQGQSAQKAQSTTAKSAQSRSGSRSSGSSGTTVHLPFVTAQFHAPEMHVPGREEISSAANSAVTQAGSAVSAVREQMPERDQALFYGALGGAAALSVIEWPVALAIGVGTALVSRSKSQSAAR